MWLGCVIWNFQHLSGYSSDVVYLYIHPLLKLPSTGLFSHNVDYYIIVVTCLNVVEVVV